MHCWLSFGRINGSALTGESMRPANVLWEQCFITWSTMVWWVDIPVIHRQFDDMYLEILQHFPYGFSNYGCFALVQRRWRLTAHEALYRLVHIKHTGQLEHRQVTYPSFKWGASTQRRTSRSEFEIIWRRAMMNKEIRYNLITHFEPLIFAFILI